MKIIINEAPKSLNDLFSMNYHARNRYKKEISETIGWICKEKNVRPAGGAVKLYFNVIFNKKRNRDYDNYLGGAKFFIDGLKDAGVIREDNSEVVKSVMMTFASGEKEKTEIYVVDAVIKSFLGDDVDLSVALSGKDTEDAEV